MANRAKIPNFLNHRRQMAWLKKGIVMLPPLPNLKPGQKVRVRPTPKGRYRNHQKAEAKA